jgi:hypothetical protein
MDRGIDREIPERALQGRDLPHGPKRASEPRENREKPARRPEPARLRTYEVSASEGATLYDIGRFRTVAEEDLSRQRYGRNNRQMRQDLRSLAEQGLVQRRTVLLNRNKGKLAVVVLTRAGKKYLERERPAGDQQVYSGFVKPAEVAHDAAIYRMYEKEARRIEGAGGKIRRVVLDYELKRKIYSPLAKAKGLPPLEYAKRQAEVAQENGLKVVQGKIPLPDLRIEYETAEGELTRVDLELATHHYHGSHLRTKVEAGFKMYGDSSCRRSAPLEDREITAEIFSL